VSSKPPEEVTQLLAKWSGGDRRAQEALMPLLRSEIRRLAAVDREQARVLELRIFDGLTWEETAEALGTSPAAVKRDWSVAKAWLAQAIKKHTARSAAPAPGKHSSPAPGKARVFRLAYTDAGESKVFLLPEGDTLVGRAPTCNLVVRDPTVSRRHARFEVTAGRCFVEDLGSRAGTHRNGQPIGRSELADGDRVSLGQLQLSLRESIPEHVALSDHHTFTQATVTLPIGRSPAERSATDSPPGGVDSSRLLTALSEISYELVRGSTLPQILDRVIAVTFETIQAERAFLMLIDEPSGELVPRVARNRHGIPIQGATISRTIAGLVLKDRIALLASDAQSDARLDGSTSIALDNVRSSMCAPLWHDTDVIGVLYVDNPQSSTFTTADLNLFVALSNYAAVAVEQTRLGERLREERRRRERLERYHSPRIIEHILESQENADDSFMAQEREISVLFADLVGFTTLAERLTPSAVAHLLNEFFGAMTDVIFAHDGTLDKFIGDAILATFGAALPQPDHAVRSVRTALDMRQALRKLNAVTGRPKLEMRIAINSGCALIGDIGSPKRREFTVLGDVVNTASRLESSVARPHQIVISGATYQLIKDEIEARPLGSINLRGRSQPVDIYEV
jgi:adenylate cyclase